jgi:hypothetical protein
MPYLTLKTVTEEQGLLTANYIVEGTFDSMVYLCADVFRNGKIGTGYAERSEEEIAQEYREQLKTFYDAVGPMLNENYIRDYSLVLTPNVCDSRLLDLPREHEHGNFIVAPLNMEDLDLVDSVRSRRW